MTSVYMTENGIYDGPATLSVAGESHNLRVRLVGHMNPIDGRYHWQGTVHPITPATELPGGAKVVITIGHRSATGRLAERTPWGTYSVVGTGAPPYDTSSL